MSDEQQHQSTEQGYEWETINDKETALIVTYRPFGEIQQAVVTMGVSPGMIIAVMPGEEMEELEMKAIVRVDVTGFDDTGLADFFQMMADKLRNDVRLDVPTPRVER